MKEKIPQYSLVDQWLAIAAAMSHLREMEPDRQGFYLGKQFAYSFGAALISEPGTEAATVRIDDLRQKARERQAFSRSKQQEATLRADASRVEANTICIETLERVIIPMLEKIQFAEKY